MTDNDCDDDELGPEWEVEVIKLDGREMKMRRIAGCSGPFKLFQEPAVAKSTKAERVAVRKGEKARADEVAKLVSEAKVRLAARAVAKADAPPDPATTALVAADTGAQLLEPGFPIWIRSRFGKALEKLVH
jgi:hypothetical protein